MTDRVKKVVVKKNTKFINIVFLNGETTIFHAIGETLYLWQGEVKADTTRIEVSGEKTGFVKLVGEPFIHN